MLNEFISKCRTCLNEASSYYEIFDDTEENCTILEMLDSIVPQINIKNNTNFSLLICETCVTKLLTGYKFQQLCIKSNTSLLDLLGVSDLKNIDPLTDEASLIKVEIGGDAYKEIESLPGKLNNILESENSVFLDDSMENDSSSSFCQTKSPVNVLRKQQTAKKEGKNENNDLKSVLSEVDRDSPIKLYEKTTEEVEKQTNTPIKEETNVEESLDDNLNNYQFVIDSVEASLGKSEKNNKKYDYTCKVCGKEFDRPSNLHRHSSVHSLARPHECTICKYRFADVKILKAHLFQHRNETVESITESLPEGCKCEVCQKSFMSMKHLARHFKNQHPEKNKYKCDYCSKTYVLHDSLKNHIKYRHQSDTNLKCQICEKVFGNANKLKQHMTTHNSYLCPHCGKTFLGTSNLRQHMERHIGLQKYQCPDCPKSFNCKSDVLKHASAHSDAKPFVCDICGSRFTRKYAMQKHKSLHTAERSYKCDRCNMSFKLFSLLKRHIRTHTGEKPYKCKFCERAYSESGDLTKHLRTHVGENTYMCDQCPKAFKYQAELRQHQSEHYKMDKKLAQAEEKNA